MLHTAPSRELNAAIRRDLRRFLDAAFEGAFTDDDWDHALGGMHAWVSGLDGIICHGSLVERTLVCSGVTLRAGYVEAVATAAAHRREGHGSAVMARINILIRDRYVLGALSTGTQAFYAPLGWECWRGLTFVDAPQGRVRTPADDGDIMILRTPRTPLLDLDGDIVCDWRAGDVW